MFTTTPFLRPRDGFEPTPTTSIVPSGSSSPTIATTFDVPMSRPTIRFLSTFLGIRGSVLLRRARKRRTIAPTDAEAVGVTHVDVADLREPLRDGRARERDETLEPLVDRLTAETHD